MPVVVNEIVPVTTVTVATYRGVRTAQYQLSIRSCDGNEILQAVFFEDVFPSSILLPDGSFARVRGPVGPGSINPESDAVLNIDANYGGIQRFYDVHGPTDITFTVIGTLHARYLRDVPCLILEVDKSYPGSWFAA